MLHKFRYILLALLLSVSFPASAVKNYLTDYNATAASNTDVGGVDVDEGNAPSTMNNAVREVMSHLKGYKNETIVGADIASATALLVNIPGILHDVTGTTTVTSLAIFLFR